MVGVKCFVHAIKLIEGIISYYTILYRLHIYDVHLIINDVFSVNMLNIDFVKRETITAKLFRRILISYYPQHVRKCPSYAFCFPTNFYPFLPVMISFQYWILKYVHDALSNFIYSMIWEIASFWL